LSKQLFKLENLRLKLYRKHSWLRPVLAFNKKEFIAFFALLGIMIASLLLLFFDFYFKHTNIVPDNGGTLIEGLIGQPRFINPIYAESNDVDRDITNLVFSGLMKYDAKGQLQMDLIKRYDIKEDGKIYEIELNDNIYFHDNIKLTAKDVAFTIKTIQNPDFKSPLLAKWLSVETEVISDTSLRFVLKNAYPGFLENLTVKILPAHIWENTSSQNFPLSAYNFKPIGSGMFKFNELIKTNDGKIKGIVLERNTRYYNQKPHLSQIRFIFFENEENLIAAAKSGMVNAIAPSYPQTQTKITGLNKYSFTMPRYFAIFFNQEKNVNLQNKDFRMALSYATNVKEIKDKVLDNNGQVVNSPFLPNIFNLQDPDNEIRYNQSEAKKILGQLGFELKDNIWVKIKKETTQIITKDLVFGAKGTEVSKLQTCLSKFPDIYPSQKVTGTFGTETRDAVIKFQEKYPEEILKPAGITKGNGKVGASTRKKLNALCSVSPEQIEILKMILTISNDPLLVAIANEVKNQWESIGITTEIQSFELTKIKQEIIKDRDYQALIFGQLLSVTPDPFSFWHSTQRNYPGLNLANYNNNKVDKLLESIRIEENPLAKISLLENAQKLLLDDLPAIFLVNPSYIYFVSDKIRGVEPRLIADPSERFADIQNWYLRTQRSFKITPTAK
jgi:ABC-type transport system substrate-binding protein